MKSGRLKIVSRRSSIRATSTTASESLSSLSSILLRRSSEIERFLFSELQSQGTQTYLIRKFKKLGIRLWTSHVCLESL